jgi:hypothetical protein
MALIEEVWGDLTPSSPPPPSPPSNTEHTRHDKNEKETFVSEPVLYQEPVEQQ